MSVSTTLDAPDTQTICLRILEAVATREAVDVADLEPRLYDAVEPDALHRLLAGTPADGHAPISVTFEYAGHDVTVASDGSLAVE